MESPLISICIPVRNDGKYVGAAIDSALSQDYPAVEILLSDNASTDNTWEVVSAREGINAFRQEKPLPMSTHWNCFRRRVLGEWVLFLCSDDLLHPQALSMCQAAFEPDVDAVFFEFDHLTSAGLKTRANFYQSSALIPAKQQHEIFIIGNNFPLTTALIRRKTLDAVNWFDENYNFCTDWHLWLKISAARSEGVIAYLTKKLAHYRLHEGNETGRCIKNRSALTEIIRMKEFFLSRYRADNNFRQTEIASASRRGNANLARRYGDSMAALGDHNTANYYYLLGKSFETSEVLQSSLQGPPYPLPEGSRPLPDDTLDTYPKESL